MKLMAIGFPKSGTTSLTRALEMSGLKAAHWQDDKFRFVGQLIYHAVVNGLDPFAHLTDYDAVTQADVCLPRKQKNYWPNLDFAILAAIRRAHPTCLFLLNYRRPEAICESLMRWRGMQQRLVGSDIPGLPVGAGGTTEQLINWIENHFQACRTYFANDPHFLEIDIESPDVPTQLGEALGVQIKGWADHKPDAIVPGA